MAVTPVVKIGDLLGAAPRGGQTVAPVLPVAAGAPAAQAVDASQPWYIKLGMLFADPGMQYELAQLGASLAAPDTWQSRVGQAAAQTAQNQIYSQYMSNMLRAMAGSLLGGLPLQQGPALSNLAVGALTPQMQASGVGAGLDLMQTLASLIPQPKQQTPLRGSLVQLELDKEGKRTPGVLHEWLVDPYTGKRVQYIGPAKTVQTGGSGGAESFAQERLLFNDLKKTAFQMMEAAGLGQIVSHADGTTTFVMTNPERDLPTFSKVFQTLLDAAVQQGLLGARWKKLSPSRPEVLNQLLTAYGAQQEPTGEQGPTLREKLGGAISRVTSMLRGSKEETKSSPPQEVDGKQFTGKYTEDGLPIYVDPKTGRKYVYKQE